MACHCAEGWICEAHPADAWPHDACAGPGMPCDNPECPWWRTSQPSALNTDDWTWVVSPCGARRTPKAPH